MRLAAICVFACLLTLAALAGQSRDPAVGKLVLDYANVDKLGCTIDDQSPYFRTTVWADYKDSPLVTEDGKHPSDDHDWTGVYSMRETRKKAFADCDDWISKTTLEVKKSQPKANEK